MDKNRQGVGKGLECLTTQLTQNKRPSEYRSKASSGVDLGEGAQGVPPPQDELQFSNTAGILQNMQICMICIFSS